MGLRKDLRFESSYSTNLKDPRRCNYVSERLGPPPSDFPWSTMSKIRRGRGRNNPRDEQSNSRRRIIHRTEITEAILITRMAQLGKCYLETTGSRWLEIKYAAASPCIIPRWSNPFSGRALRDDSRKERLARSTYFMSRHRPR